MKELKKLDSSQVRSMFLEFFKEHGHTIMPSASLVPVNDPTLLWINSGVATMKKYFDGKVVPKNPRMTSSQKSIRTNDIENVGKTARHHTMFEMLGNFSVGDYFKKEVIPWAWELLTSDKWFAFDPDRIYITYYPKDTETHDLWRKVGVAEDHLVQDKDNFWDIGQGPSGPDTEMYYDRGQEFNDIPEDDVENYPGGENQRYLEIWNIVFSQFNHTPEDTYEPLPHKNIDTGMGLERVVSIFENAPTNFETDLFLPLIKQTESYSTKQYHQDKDDDVQFKIIADHIRTITFAIGDGALPSNMGRGYVIRRLLRRAVVAGKKLGINENFLYKMVPTVGKIMQSYYPDVLENADYIQKVIKSEEERFSSTLNGGLTLLNDVIASAKQDGTNQIDGQTAFKLYDTYGFPIELTREYANDEGLTVDEDGFQAAMTEQQNRARNARNMDNGMGVQKDVWTEFTTPSKYVGYTQLTVDNAKVIGLVQDGQHVDVAKPAEKSHVEVIFDTTPFYAEMGGQVADTGVIIDNYGKTVGRVVDVQHAPHQQNLHEVELQEPLKLNARYKLVVDRERHLKIEKNHTATHLLDQALRNVLGGHTKQAGSLVEEHYLRFDFNHFGQVTAKDLQAVEDMVNEQIWKEIPVATVETDIDSAKEMGAIALFSEKYGDRVRVVKIGDFNTEFCGGDHVHNTNELGLFKIVSEGGVGAGIRRIEAVTASDAYQFMQKRVNLLQTVADDLKVSQLKEVPHRVNELTEQLKEANGKVESLEAKIASQQAADVFGNVQKTANGTLIAAAVNVAGMGQLRQLADKWREQQLSDVLVLATPNGEKANMLVAVSDDAVKNGLKAGDIMKQLAPAINGGGGGRPTLAQAGGSNPAGIDKAIKQATDVMNK